MNTLVNWLRRRIHRGRPNRTAFIWLPVLLLAIDVPLAVAQHVANPFSGATQYVNPDYTKEVNSAIATLPAGSALANQMSVVATYPTAVWLDRMAAIAGGSANNGRMSLQQHIQAALAQQKGTQPIVVELVIYDLPDRDCAALASNGEISIAPNPPTQPLSGIQTYEQNYITPIFNILASFSTNPNIRFVLVIEDDSLPNMITNTGLSFSLPNCIAANDGQSYPTLSMNGVYVQGIQYALNQFHSLPNVYNYLDVGHHGWLGWPANLTAAVPFFLQVAQGTTAGVSSVDGFITNTANYGPTKEPFMTATEQIGGTPVFNSAFYQFNPNIDEEDYAAQFDAALVSAGFPSTLGFLIDTSRNGWGGPNRPTGPSTSTVLNTFVDATKIDQRDDMGQWCNQANQGLGVPPTVNPGFFTNLYAYVWIKPPGESDGNYPGSVFNGVTSTTGDPNCDPAHSNALANSMLTGAIPNSPPAGTFWTTEFQTLVQNAFPPIPASTAAGFTVAAPGVTVEQGTTATDSVTVSSINGFNSAVTLSISGLPAGVTASFGTNPTTGSSVLTLTAGSAAATGTSTLTITGTSGALTASSSVSLTVSTVQTPSFTLAAAAATLLVTQGSAITDTVTVMDAGGFAGSVTLAASGLPSGVGAVFSTNPTTGNSVLTLTASSTATAGTSNVIITGTSGTLTATVSLALTIKAPIAAGFACHVDYTLSSEWPGGFGAAITINNTGTTALSNWTLTWTFANGQTISQLWNGIEAQSGANVSVANESYNGNIPSGGSYSGMGFNGTWNNTTNTAPTSFAVNGVACQ
jgi:cellulose 1,4-beta-cellobiosidase